MEVGFMQFCPIFGEIESNLRLIKNMLKNSNTPEILVLPELALTGYSFKDYKEAYSFSEEVGGDITKNLVNLADEHKTTIALGFLERDGKNLYNSSLLLGAEGVIGVYRKIHLFYREKEIFMVGDMGFPVFTINGVKVGLLVCFDWIYPEAMRTLALKGADLILHSANLILPYYQDAARTRAIENRVFIVLANRTGVEKRQGNELEFTGCSEVVNPRGEVILKVGRNEEGIFIININPEESRDKNVTEFNNIFKDRKEEYYEGWHNR
jgi:predicted amidohydrolase